MVRLFLGLLLGELRGLHLGEVLGLLLGVRTLLLPNTGDMPSVELNGENGDGVLAIVPGVKFTPLLLDFFLTGVL